jgi:hypothetical protein
VGLEHGVHAIEIGDGTNVFGFRKAAGDHRQQRVDLRLMTDTGLASVSPQ